MCFAVLAPRNGGLLRVSRCDGFARVARYDGASPPPKRVDIIPSETPKEKGRDKRLRRPCLSVLRWVFSLLVPPVLAFPRLRSFSGGNAAPLRWRLISVSVSPRKNRERETASPPVPSVRGGEARSRGEVLSVRLSTHTLVDRLRQGASGKAIREGYSAIQYLTDTKFNLLCSSVCVLA